MEIKILILGGSSFLAQNYVDFDSNNKLTCVVRNKKKLIKKKNVKYIFLNKISNTNLKKIIFKSNYSVILNFISNNNNSSNKYFNNKKIISDNIIPGLEILETIKDLDVKYITFDSFERIKNKISAYVLSKKILSYLNSFYKKKYNLNIINIFLPTVIGKFDNNKNRIIPFITSYNKLDKPNRIISFSFAEDIVKSIKKSIEKNSEIKFKIYKKKAIFFQIQYLNLKKKVKKDKFSKKLDKILLFYKKIN